MREKVSSRLTFWLVSAGWILVINVDLTRKSLML